jgi:hypothetical protein
MTRIRRCITHLLVLTVIACAGCHKKQEKPKSAKRQREEILQRANDEQVAVDKFVASVSEVLQWHQLQPIASGPELHQTVIALAQKMEQVPADGLPPDLSSAWKAMLKSWQALAKTATPDDTLREDGARAAQELNRQLLARDVVGIRF